MGKQGSVLVAYCQRGAVPVIGTIIQPIPFN